MEFGKFRMTLIAISVAFAFLIQLGFATSVPMPLPNIAGAMNQNLQYSVQHYGYNGGPVHPKFVFAVSKSKNVQSHSDYPEINQTAIAAYKAYSVIGTPSSNLSLILQDQAAQEREILSGGYSNLKFPISYGSGVTNIFSGSSSSQVSSAGIQKMVFAVYTNQMATDLTTTLKPYVSSGDEFDLVSGNNGDPLNITRVLNWANQIHKVYPNSIIFAHTAGLTNYAKLSAGVSGSVIKGVFYDYEPNMSNEPEFTWNFANTISNFEKVTAIAHQYGLLSIAYPTGRPMIESDLQTYGWNYATIAKNVDALSVQSQTDCHNSVTNFDSATQSVISTYASAHTAGVPVFQVTVGGGGVNAVSSSQAYSCTGILTNEGFNTVYVWWGDSNLSDLEAYLKLIGR